MVWITSRLRQENLKKGENGNEEGSKGGSFTRRNLFFEKHVFT